MRITDAFYEAATRQLVVEMGDGTVYRYINVGEHCWAVWRSQNLSYFFWRDYIHPAYLTVERAEEMRRQFAMETTNGHCGPEPGGVQAGDAPGSDTGAR